MHIRMVPGNKLLKRDRNMEERHTKMAAAESPVTPSITHHRKRAVSGKYYL
jgi:hypothetical protein